MRYAPELMHGFDLQEDGDTIPCHKKRLSRRNNTLEAKERSKLRVKTVKIEGDAIDFLRKFIEIHTSLENDEFDADIATMAWDGNIEKLFSYSLFISAFDNLRISPDGTITLFGPNFKGINESTTCGIQNAIIRKFRPDYRETETDIEITLPTEAMNFPKRKLPEIYVEISSQVNAVRRRISHLLQIEEGELIRIELDSTRSSYGARMKKGETISRENPEKYTCRTEYTRTDQGYLLDPEGLQAELRHHIHHLSLKQTNKLCLAFDGMAETIDDMRMFAKLYDKRRRIFREIPEKVLDSTSDFTNKLARALWLFNTLIDSEGPRLGGIGTRMGHNSALHIVHELAKTFAKGKKTLSPDDIEKIDKAVFDFLTNMTVDENYEKLFKKHLRSVRENAGENTAEYREAKQMQELYDEYLRQVLGLSKLNERHKTTTGSASDELDLQISEKIEILEPMYQTLSQFMLEKMPYIAPDGKAYPSLTSYCLDPEIIYKAMIERHPELA